MPFRTAEVLTCSTNPATSPVTDLYQNVSDPLTMTGPLQPDGVSTGTALAQRRRITANVALVTDATSPNGVGYWRGYHRPAPVGTVIAGEKSTFGYDIHLIPFTYARITVVWRRTAALNTKGVVGLMPTGGWNAPLIQAELPTGKRQHEADFNEWFDGKTAATIASTGGPKVTSPMHWLTGSGDNQVVMDAPSHSFAAWSTTIFDTLPDQVNMLIDGVQVTTKGGSGNPRPWQWPLTDNRFICIAPQKIMVHGGLLIDANETLASTPWEANAYVDVASVSVAQFYSDTTVDEYPSVPGSLAVTAFSNSANLSWGVSIDPEGATVGYVVQRALAPGGVVNTASWTEVSPAGGQTGRTLTLSGLSPSTGYAFRVAAQDQRGINGRSGYSTASLFTTPAVTTTPPVLAAVVDPLQGDPPLGVTVDPAGTTGTLTSFTIDWGDGTTGYSNSSLPGAPVTHIYAAEGSYSLVVTASNAGGSSVRTFGLNVSNSIPDDQLPPRVFLLVDTDTLTADPLRVGVDPSPTRGTVTNFTIDWGDGSPDYSRPFAPGWRVEHVYVTQPPHTITVNASGLNGADTSTVEVTTTTVTPAASPDVALWTYQAAT